MSITLFKVLSAVGMILLMLVITAVIFAYPVKWIWNDLMVSIFQLRTISGFEAWELNVLCGIMFKSSMTSSK